MKKVYDMEAMAGMSIDQIDAMAVGGDTPTDGEEASTPEGSPEGEQVVEDSATSGAPEEEEQQGGVAMKSGKGTIPYAVLKETRDELAETKRKLDALQPKPYQAVVPENHAEMMAQAHAEQSGLAKKFEDGDIDWEEYQSQLGVLTSQKEALLAARIKSEISTEMQEQIAQEAGKFAQAEWDQVCSEFLASKIDGVDYTADKALLDELDANVKMFANNPAYAGKGDQWCLAKAHREVLENHGLASGAKKQPATDADPGPQRPPIFSLSDIPGGSLPAGNEIEQATALSGAALTNRFINDPSQIDKMLSSIG